MEEEILGRTYTNAADGSVRVRDEGSYAVELLRRDHVNASLHRREADEPGVDGGSAGEGHDGHFESAEDWRTL